MSESQAEKRKVWVFLGEGATHAAAVFSSLEKAEAWIASSEVSGILTAYPLDQSVYDWMIERGSFRPKKDYQRQPKFIGSFSSAYAEHYHYEAGRRIA